MKPETIKVYSLTDVLDHFDIGMDEDILYHIGSDHTWGDTAYSLISAPQLIFLIAEYLYASEDGIREEYEIVFDPTAYIDLES